MAFLVAQIALPVPETKTSHPDFPLLLDLSRQDLLEGFASELKSLSSRPKGAAKVQGVRRRPLLPLPSQHLAILFEPGQSERQVPATGRPSAKVGLLRKQFEVREPEPR